MELEKLLTKLQLACLAIRNAQEDIEESMKLIALEIQHQQQVDEIKKCGNPDLNTAQPAGTRSR